MYSHIKVSKLNQCESNNQRCLPDTTKVASCIHKIFLPCIKPYKALLLVAFSHFKSSPSSNTRADEYSCFQQISQHHTLQHHNMQELPSKTQGYVRPCVYNTEGLSQGCKDGQSSICGIKWSHSFIDLFGSKTKDEMIWRREDLTEPKHHKTISPQREICTEQGLQKVWVESKSYIVLLEVLNIFVKRKKLEQTSST